jgi:hypothetical protein
MWNEEDEEENEDYDYDLYDEPDENLEDTVNMIISTAKKVMEEAGDNVTEVTVELNGVKIGFKK